MTHLSWVAPWAWLSFIDQAVVHVIRLASFLWLWFWCVCRLMPSRNTYHLRFLLPWNGVSLHGCSSKAQQLLLTLDKGYLLTAAPPDLERGVAPLGRAAHTQSPLLGRGVAPVCCRPDLGGRVVPLGLSCAVATPDLGRGVTPLDHASARSVAAGARSVAAGALLNPYTHKPYIVLNV